MSQELLCVDQASTVAEAASLMAQRRVGSVLVVDGSRPAGILTERDIVRAVSHDVMAMHEPILDWLTRDPVTIAADADVFDARRLMVEGNFRHLPVMAEGRLVGMLSMRDLARAALEAEAEADRKT